MYYDFFSFQIGALFLERTCELSSDMRTMHTKCLRHKDAKASPLTMSANAITPTQDHKEELIRCLSKIKTTRPSTDDNDEQLSAPDNNEIGIKNTDDENNNNRRIGEELDFQSMRITPICKLWLGISDKENMRSICNFKFFH